MNIKRLISCCLILFYFTGLMAQTEISDQQPKKIQITLTDGSIIKGVLLETKDDVLKIDSDALGIIDVSLQQIKETKILYVSELELDPKGIPFDYHNSTHHLFGQSAYNLKKGQSYYENIGIFFNSYTTGITDNFSVSLGGEIASLLFASNFPVVFVSPKFSIPFQNNSGAFAVGGTFFTTPEDDFNTYGFLTTTVTLGHRNNNFSLGTGIGWSSIDGFDNSIVPFTLSTMQRIGPKLSFVSENWVIFDNSFGDVVSVLSAALRIHFKNPGSAFNLGLFRPTEDTGNLIGIPYVSATLAIK